MRERVGLPAFPYTATIKGKATTFADTQDGLRAAIRHERRVEFGMEGQRWFDLCRWGIVKQTMESYKQTESAEAQSPDWLR